MRDSLLGIPQKPTCATRRNYDSVIYGQALTLGTKLAVHASSLFSATDDGAIVSYRFTATGGAFFANGVQMGTIAAGKSADFVALDANPLEDIRNTRQIARVYLRGVEVNRTELRSKFGTAGKP